MTEEWFMWKKDVTATRSRPHKVARALPFCRENTYQNVPDLLTDWRRSSEVIIANIMSVFVTPARYCAVSRHHVCRLGER